MQAEKRQFWLTKDDQKLLWICQRLHAAGLNHLATYNVLKALTSRSEPFIIDSISRLKTFGFATTAQDTSRRGRPVVVTLTEKGINFVGKIRA